MKREQITRSKQLFEALDAIPDIRSGLKESHDQEMWFELGAMEGDDRGGVGHGNALLPPDLAKRILKFAEELIRAELKKLGAAP